MGEVWKPIPCDRLWAGEWRTGLGDGHCGHSFASEREQSHGLGAEGIRGLRPDWNRTMRSRCWLSHCWRKPRCLAAPPQLRLLPCVCT